MITKIAGLVLFILAIIVFVLAGGSPERFVYIPAFVIVVFGSASLTLMKYKKGDGSQKVLRSLQKNVILSSLLAMLISFMQILWSIEAPDQLSYVLGVVLTAPLYGLILYCIIDNFRD